MAHDIEIRQYLLDQTNVQSRIKGQKHPQSQKRLEKHQDKNKVMTQYQHDVIVRRLEKLRTDNELLREGGQYWYELSKKWLKP